MTALLASLAHPGHGTTDGGSLAHYLAEPLHVAALVALVTVAAIGVYLLTRSSGARH
jgi:hypothetical protein